MKGRKLLSNQEKAARLAARMNNYVVDKSGCWIWQGSKSCGYGVTSYDGRVVKAHRISYTMHIGPIPPMMCIDHLCMNKPCINPEHLEIVTSAENARRYWASLENRIATRGVVTPKSRIYMSVMLRMHYPAFASSNGTEAARILREIAASIEGKTIDTDLNLKFQDTDGNRACVVRVFDPGLKQSKKGE